MRTLLTFAPLLLCAGMMVACFRMMGRKHDDSATADHDVAEASHEVPAALPARPRTDRTPR